MEYHSDRFIDNSLMIYKNKKVVALLPANLKGETIYSHQGLTYGGLLMLASLKIADVLELFKELLTYLESIDIQTLYLKQIPSFYNRLPSEGLDYLLQLVQGACYRVDSASVIDYRNDIQIQSNRLEGVKKAQKHDLLIKEEDNLEDFWDVILIPNLKEQHNAEPTHSIEEITLLKKAFPNNIRQFNVYHNGQIVGGATIFETSTTAHVQYISANSKKQTLGTLDFLFNHLIKITFKDKRYFDFGTSNENAGKQLNKGLTYWKECFGARTFVHRSFKINTANHIYLNNVLV